MKKELELKLNTLPNVPGIYKFLNNKGEILYIGKAIDLKKRVSSYFLKDPIDRPRIMQMLPQVSDMR